MLGPKSGSRDAIFTNFYARLLGSRLFYLSFPVSLHAVL